jgi:hypothetical protein
VVTNIPRVVRVLASGGHIMRAAKMHRLTVYNHAEQDAAAAKAKTV